MIEGVKMAILFSNAILDSVKRELQNATDSVQIITAYCKDSSLKYLNRYIRDSVTNKRLLVRFRMDDIIKGSTDFSILENGIDTGWDVYIRFDLHAKTYVVDNKRCFIGSANATNSGLSIGRRGNIEMATLIDVEMEDIERIGKLFDDAIYIDRQLLERMQEQLEVVRNSGRREHYSWDKSIITLFNPHIDTLFSYELPEDFSLHKGEYFSFMDETFTGDINKIKETFRFSNSYLWLITTLKENEGCMYFGALSEKLHYVMISDPKPYRRDIKHMLENLLRLCEQLEMEEIVIDRPNYSQRIRLV